jgi:methylthioribose-1-phosphate isomerase
MKINGVSYRSIWLSDNGWSVNIFDQRKLPWELEIVELRTAADAACAIKEMWTRGAPLLAMTAAYGLCLALRENPSDHSLDSFYKTFLSTRPTAVNLRWALDEMMKAVKPFQGKQRIKAAYMRAADLCEEDIAINRAIGNHGLPLIKNLVSQYPGRPINILMHCNPGWLATVDYGTATAPIYFAHDAGIPVHVWVDETRPRNQGVLTAYELAQHGVPHTLITDNAGGLLMQQGKVDLCFVGADRVTRNGDSANKIGTYLKAVAAKDNNVPFYVALPYTTFDPSLESGDSIPIEERNAEEITTVQGKILNGALASVRISEAPVFNPGFDITPARLITGYITDKGIREKPQDLYATAA